MAKAWRMAPQEFEAEVPLERLSEWPDNPNEGAEAVLSESLDEHGFYGGVFAQKSSGRMIGGNHRLREAISRGAPSLPVFWLDVDDEEAAKILAVDNESTRAGGYNMAKLVALLAPMSSLAGTGFSADKLTAMSALVNRRGAYGDEPTDPDSEWEGMPGFDQPSRSSLMVRIHFPDEDAAVAFFAALGMPRAPWMWWPAPDGFVAMDAGQVVVMERLAAGIVRDKPVQFGCPSCGAKAGDGCTGLEHGEPTGSYHTARRALAAQDGPGG